MTHMTKQHPKVLAKNVVFTMIGYVSGYANKIFFFDDKHRCWIVESWFCSISVSAQRLHAKKKTERKNQFEMVAHTPFAAHIFKHMMCYELWAANEHWMRVTRIHHFDYVPHNTNIIKIKINSDNEYFCIIFIYQINCMYIDTECTINHVTTRALNAQAHSSTRSCIDNPAKLSSQEILTCNKKAKKKW